MSSIRKTVQVREAKAGLSALIDLASKGEVITITRHGVPAAVMVSVEAAEKLVEKLEKPTFEELLFSFPGGIEFWRDSSPPREIDLFCLPICWTHPSCLRKRRTA